MRQRRIAWLGALWMGAMAWMFGAFWGQDAWAEDPVAAAVVEAAEEAASTLGSVEAMAQENSFAINNVWLLVTGALVFLMQLGFGCLESGFLPQKHTVNIMMKNLMDFSLGAIAFFLVGFSIMYNGGESGWFGFNGFGLSGFAPETTFAAAEAGYSHYADWFFQVVFAATAATIASGAMAGRTAFKGYLVFTVFVTALIYPISGFWKWGGGWLDARGFQDYAGSMVVHGCGGFIALAGAIVLGPRIGRFPKGQSRPIQGHSLSLAFIGCMLLFFGWYGFNAGSELAAVGGYLEDSASGSAVKIGQVCVTTLLAGAGGATGAMLLIWPITGRPDLGTALNGVLGGLVGITANCNQVSPGSAIIIGIVAGVIVTLGTIMLDRLRIDDPVGAISVHGVVGLWGIFAVLLSDPDATFMGQLIGALVIFVWVFVTSLIAGVVVFSVLGHLSCKV